MQYAATLAVVPGLYPSTLHSAPLAVATSNRVALAVYLDVLLPRDNFSPSATDLGVDKQIWQFADKSELFLRLLLLGTQWLDKTGGPPFKQLDPIDQSALVAWMADSDPNRIPGRFYHLVREAAVEFYFSHPDSWAGLGIDHPPQPQGFPPPWS
jgi:hypothetical protein